MSCTYKSITLQPGESYVLPAGAQIISATDTAGITSVNDCADLSQIEQLDCYGFILVLREDADSDSQPYDADSDTKYIGVYLNNVYYPFGSPYTEFYSGGTNTVEQCFSTLPFTASITNFCQSYALDNSNDILKYFVIFNTIPSIANTLELVAVTDAPNQGVGSGVPPAEYRIPCLLRSTIISQGHLAQGSTEICNCPTS